MSAPRSTPSSRTWSACSTRSTPPSSTARCPRSPKVSAARASGSARPPPTPIRFCSQLNPRSETIRADWQALKGFNDAYSGAAQDILTTLERGQHDQRDHHQPRQAAGCVAAGHDWALQQRDQPAGAESGQPDQGHQRARADDEPAVQVQPGVHLPAGGREVPAGHRRLRSARRQRAIARAGRRRWRSATTRTTIRTTCRSSAPRADRAANRAAARCPIVDEQLAGAPARHQHRIRHRRGLAAQPRHRLPGLRPTTCRSPARCPSRRASATSSAGPRRDRSRIREPRPTVRDLYAPDGTPLWPGLPPAPPPMAPRDPGPTPGSEPFVVPAPAQMQPTPLPPDSTAAGGCPVALTVRTDPIEPMKGNPP